VGRPREWGSRHGWRPQQHWRRVWWRVEGGNSFGGASRIVQEALSTLCSSLAFGNTAFHIPRWHARQRDSFGDWHDGQYHMFHSFTNAETQLFVWLHAPALFRRAPSSGMSVLDPIGSNKGHTQVPRLNFRDCAGNVHIPRGMTMTSGWPRLLRNPIHCFDVGVCVRQGAPGKLAFFFKMEFLNHAGLYDSNRQTPLHVCLPLPQACCWVQASAFYQSLPTTWPAADRLWHHSVANTSGRQRRGCPAGWGSRPDSPTVVCLLISHNGLTQGWAPGGPPKSPPKWPLLRTFHRLGSDPRQLDVFCALLEARYITEVTLAFTCVLVSPPGSHDSLSLWVQHSCSKLSRLA